MPLLLLASSAVTVAITGIWWVAPLGLIASAIVAFQSLSLHSSEATESERSSEYDLAPLRHDLRVKFGAALKAREEIAKELEDAPENAFLNADEISSRMNEVVDGYYKLLLKLEKVSPFIDRSVTMEVKRSIDQLKVEIERCSDDVTHENLSLALKNKMDQLNSLEALGRFKERVESQLMNLIAGLNSLHIRIVQVKLSPDSSLDPTSGIRESINDMLLNIEFSENAAREFHRFLAGATEGVKATSSS